MEQVLKDERFAHIGTDVRFRSVPRRERMVKIDKRFQSMFTEKKFKVKFSVDKRGRPQNDTTDEHLKKYYELSSSSDEEDDQAGIKDGYQKADQLCNIAKTLRSQSKTRASVKREEFSSENDSADNSSDQKLAIDYARGEGNAISSTSDESSSDEDDNDAGMVHPWGELSIDASEADQISHRLAICNMDWDRVAARDLFVLVKSFTPPGGDVLSVKVYLSDFGRERLKEEEVCGPKELTGDKLIDNDSRVDDPEGEKYHMEKLRQYQLNRLKYYYGVVECDSKETANKIYEECDGLEYESSASRLDLRFIPDDVTFDEEPHSIASGSADLSNYRPKYFKTSALQHAKVQLTWDETNPDRLQAIHKAFDKDDEQAMDLKAYLATSSEESDVAMEQPNDSSEETEESDSASGEEHENQNISQYRALLQSIEAEEESKKKDKDVELEITWGTGLKEKAESIVQSKLTKKELTPWEHYLETKKEKKKKKREEKKLRLKPDTHVNSATSLYSDDELPSDVDLNDPFFEDDQLDDVPKKIVRHQKMKTKGQNEEQVVEKQHENAKQAELELLLMDEDASKYHFSLKKLLHETQKKKGKKENFGAGIKEEEFQVNVQDSRFAAIYNSHAYNIDPSEPSFKKTKGMEALIREKQKRQQECIPDLQLQKSTNTTSAPRSDTSRTELSLLVKSVKNKASTYQLKRKK